MHGNSTISMWELLYYIDNHSTVPIDDHQALFQQWKICGWCISIQKIISKAISASMWLD